MVLRVSSGRLSYEIDVCRKISVIAGGSGEGKTSFVNVLERQLQRNKEALYEAFGNPLMLVRPMAQEQILSALNGYENHSIGVLDRDTIGLSNELADKINRTPMPFIIISREKISSIPVHYDSVYKLTLGSGGTHRAERLYTPKLGLRRGIPTYVEDSGLAYWFYTRLLGSGCVEPAIGTFSKIPRRLNEALSAELSMHREFQLIADAATFGCCCGDIDDLSRVTCFLPESFEEVLADSEVFSRFRSINKADPLSAEAMQYMSMERYYENEVGRITSGLAHTKYRKGGGRAEICAFGECLGCAKRPSPLRGDGSCGLFSLYDKDAAVECSVDSSLHQMPLVTTSNYVVLGPTGGIERKTQAGVSELLSKALRVLPEDLAGKLIEKQIWAESGQLQAVKANGRWHELIRHRKQAGM